MDPRLYNSAKSGNIDVLNQLLNENPSLILKLTPHENTVLHIAARSGHKNIVAEIYGRMRSLLRHPNLDGDTPLHVAARAGHFSILSFLIAEISSLSWIGIENERNRGIEILRWRNRWNNTVLHEAVRNHHVAVVELLIKVDSELACSRNNAGESPLYLAARDGMGEIVNQILRLAPSCAHGGSDGQTALHAAIVAGCNDIMEMLLRVEPQLISESDDRGWTPLHYAASLGDEKTLGQLLELDITTVYILDKHGQSPLHVAASKGRTNVIKQIIRYCPDSGELLDLNGRNALHVAVLNGKVNVVRCILETTELEELLNQTDGDGNTPLHLATIGGKSWIIRYLMWDDRIDQRAKNRSGQTPIDIDNSIGESCTSPRIQISKIWRQLSIPRTWTVREKILPSPNQEEASATIQTYKKMGHTLLMVDTLIATVTFAAAFTMPGGFNNEIGPNQGLALLASSNDLKWFIIADTIAMVCSITAACVIFWGAIIGRESYGYYFLSATGLTYIALQSTAAAFTNVLHIAARSEHKNIVAEIYGRMRSLLWHPNLDGDTPLHVAARAGHFSILSFLIAEISSLSWIDIENERNRGIEILRWRNRWNNTVLHEAVRNHHVAVVELLIKVDPKLACSRNNTGESSLYLAARDGMVEIVNQILRLAPSCAHGGSDGQMALHAAIVGGP
ncbi:hypothetical protein F0562_010157 [Nyssa sinensis]|uniref:PGG domain-containing protein n=1 Tax=Nyssa sinensis TaxID=561372 RepID=A0A5J5A0Q6_9ASTE|nr:hypothetical protein F0562_010157 [Nyssa sinensis]